MPYRNIEDKRMQARRWRWKAKIETLSHYANGDAPCCKHCGETDIRVLQLDHIDGGGNEHRRKLGTRQRDIYYLLRRGGYPAGYQVLCANCNIRKHFVECDFYEGGM